MKAILEVFLVAFHCTGQDLKNTNKIAKIIPCEKVLSNYHYIYLSLTGRFDNGLVAGNFKEVI